MVGRARIGEDTREPSSKLGPLERGESPLAGSRLVVGVGSRRLMKLKKPERRFDARDCWEERR